VIKVGWVDMAKRDIEKNKDSVIQLTEIAKLLSQLSGKVSQALLDLSRHKKCKK